MSTKTALRPDARPALRKSSLSPLGRQFVSEMQRLNHGRFEQLTIRDGQPMLQPPPRRVADVKFGAQNGPRVESDSDDFELKAEVIELFRWFREIGDGVIDVLYVKYGLPFQMHVELPL